jgi:hypothetical protein
VHVPSACSKRALAATIFGEVIATHLANFGTSGSLTAAFNRLPQSNTWPAPVLINELDAGLFKGTSYNFESRASRFACPSFELMHGYNSDARCISKFLLAPRKKPAPGPTLLGCDHPLLIAGFAMFPQFHRKSIDLL